jgi:hypothetical protein
MASQVRVLPPPPAFARFASYGSASQNKISRSEVREGCRAEAEGRRRILLGIVSVSVRWKINDPSPTRLC